MGKKLGINCNVQVGQELKEYESFMSLSPEHNEYNSKEIIDTNTNIRIQ